MTALHGALVECKYITVYFIFYIYILHHFVVRTVSHMQMLLGKFIHLEKIANIKGMGAFASTMSSVVFQQDGTIYPQWDSLGIP